MTTRHLRALLLAAGLGTRLRPLTEDWPKCLMPIGGRPLLDYWLATLRAVGVERVLVNRHHHAEQVAGFLARPCFASWVTTVQELHLLGTAGTLRANRDFFLGSTILLVHADNWCQCDFSAFVAAHQMQANPRCPITMMTFDSDDPQSCGIVETDPQGRVSAFHEKVAHPPGCRANAAVYLLEPEILDWIEARPSVTDFSTQVLPHFIGRIATWHNHGIHRDIGTPRALLQAQSDPLPPICWPPDDDWQRQFAHHAVHRAMHAQASNPTLSRVPA